MRHLNALSLRRAVVGAGTMALVLAGCSGGTSGDGVERAASTPTSSPTASLTTQTPDPGKLTGRLYRSDVLITSAKPLSKEVVRRVKAIKEVEKVEPLSVGSMSVEGRTLTMAAVDPATYRTFTPKESAYADDVWGRVAGGEVAVDPTVPRKVIQTGDLLALGDAEDAEQVHVGAFAPLSKGFSGVVNHELGEQLGLPKDNALLVSTGLYTPSFIAKELRRALDGQAAMTILALEFESNVQTAVLTGASVPAAVGSFTYKRGPNGTIRPDQQWITTYIRTEPVPILGDVTCNKALFPQLRAALQEVVDRGLADKIHPGEYAGCFYPRYIARSPENGLSLHSWGIALDLNVPGNQRGTVGEMDRSVVAIFKKWGFAWGGDWSYTDPMHFEMNRVVSIG